MSDLPFDRLPPDILEPTPGATSGALAGAADQPTVQSRWFGTIVGGSKATGIYVQLFADPPGHYITVGSELQTTPSSGTVIVGFLSDSSVAIVGVP